LIHSAVAGSEVRIHVSRKSDLETGLMGLLQIAVWISHPWLGDGITQVYGDIPDSPLPLPLTTPVVSNGLEPPQNTTEAEFYDLTPSIYQQP
ncbi:MAG TPA: histidine kinase, partial [Cyanobacteria bacterium UBA11148]|nr:histidine kinase [Cyanobacteria bacterium UBA11148]